SVSPLGKNARPLFAGLPLQAAGASNSIDGSWNFRAALPDEEDYKQTIAFSVKRDGTVKVEGFGKDTSCSGTFRDGKLLLTMKDEDGTFFLEGERKEGTLAGEWRKEGTNEKGAWSASRADTRPAELASTALAELKEYVRA